MVVQWLRLCAHNAGGINLIPDQVTRPYAAQLRRQPPSKDPAYCDVRQIKREDVSSRLQKQENRPLTLLLICLDTVSDTAWIPCLPSSTALEIRKGVGLGILGPPESGQLLRV